MNKSIFFRTLSVMCLCIVIHLDAQAWGMNGHRIIGQIAENHLNDKTRAELKKLIGNQKISYWTNWADFIKSDTTWKMADEWHYYNILPNKSYEEFKAIVSEDSLKNILSMSTHFVEILKDNQQPLIERQRALYFLIHLIGDLHQPMHMGRAEDRGGNDIKVNWFNQPSNLHRVWDSDLIEMQQLSFSEFAAYLDIPENTDKVWEASGDIYSWAYDSYIQAETIYQNVSTYQSLGYSYNYQHYHLLEQQLIKGGIRLAITLNNLFSE